MKVIADLHIHSSYSRATSSRLSPPWLERWARIKGIGLLGTGDCTHPQWLADLRSQTDDAEEGLYVLKKEVREAFDSGPALIEGLPQPGKAGASRGACGITPRFILTGEISTIYKRGEKTRKVHHLVVLPDFRAAAAFNARLEGMGGNIRSDGRPILGIDSRDLLALLLETDERAMLIPAHIWTPWFSVLGEKSGFDSVEECYGDLARFIPAVETGLSSNPPMNWALQSLDRYSIISSSDAHSPEKLGREAAIFDMELSYASLKKALTRAAQDPLSHDLSGTIEFFPQEGKYHYDGHRKCGVSLGPEEAAAANHVCPVCGKPLTRGVMGRVLELADRRVNEAEPCPADYIGTNRRPYHSLIPLREIAAELLGTGAASKKAEAAYYRLIEKGGNEFSILMDMRADDLEKLSVPGLSGELLAEAVTKMRAGEVSVSPGYDGEYGVVRVFAPHNAPQSAPQQAAGSAAELHYPKGGEDLFGEFRGKAERRSAPKSTGAGEKPQSPRKEKSPTENPARLHDKRPAAAAPETFAPDADQEKAVTYNGNEMIIIAGPGTGKTTVITNRIARFIREGADPASILAITFTVKAAAELRERIEKLRGPAQKEATVSAMTFHAFCCAILREHSGKAGFSRTFRIIGGEERDALLREIGGKSAGRLGIYIEERKRRLLLPGEEFPKFTAGSMVGRVAGLPNLPETDIPRASAEMEPLYAEYRKALKKSSALDFEDLCAGTVRLLAAHPDIAESCRLRFRHVFVDEYQDINFSQYLLLRLLAPGGSAGPSLCVIGDPNQAIYGFRGSDKKYIDRFLYDYPEAGVFRLSKSFRCAGPIINAAARLTGTTLRGREEVARPGDASPANPGNTGSPNSGEVSLYRTKYATEKSEAEGIARTIENLLGGTSFFAMDSGALSGNNGVGPGDCAVLVRTAALAAPITRALKDHGIPFELSGEIPWWKAEPVNTIVESLRKREEEVEEETKEEAGGAALDLKPADIVKAAWEEFVTREKRAGGKKETRELAEKLISLAGFFGDLPSLIDTLDSCAASGVMEPEFPGTEKLGVIRNRGVRVMTMHASKGLEFEHVFAAGLEEELLPFTLFAKDGENSGERIEEERRLLYVAMTRAKQGLWLSWAESRLYRGRKLAGAPSRFLSELEKIIPLSKDGVVKKRDRQLKLF